MSESVICQPIIVRSDADLVCSGFDPVGTRRLCELDALRQLEPRPDPNLRVIPKGLGCDAEGYLRTEFRPDPKGERFEDVVFHMASKAIGHKVTSYAEIDEYFGMLDGVVNHSEAAIDKATDYVCRHAVMPGVRK